MITKTPRDMSQGKDLVACIVDAGKTIEARANHRLDELMADMKNLENLVWCEVPFAEWPASVRRDFFLAE